MARRKLVVHMIGNAHLDPAWLWAWPAGVDEAVATCRTACDLLDEYPDFCMTRGEAWVHAWVQRLAPALFERIRKHVRSGRWCVVNGWWIQPDCNLPTAASFRRHASMGKRYFRENLGVDVTVGYNVDSFGHAAMIPAFLREAGMDTYLFMRPQEHEKALPGNPFTWKSPDGAAVTAFRVSGFYNAGSPDALKNVLKQTIEAANREVGHAMCFYGVGDHGGGPTREEVEWIAAHRRYAEGVELRFSHPRAFFDAVRAGGVALPVVEGELLMHAIGCYSVVHDMKQQMRRAECMAVQAGCLLDAESGASGEDRASLEKAWERILFNQFHDILAGSSIAPVYEQARDDLGMAKAVAREILVTATRRRVGRLPPCPRHRMLLVNASGEPFQGFLEFEPWFGGGKKGIRLTDSQGRNIRCQRISVEAAVEWGCRLLMEADVPPQGEQVVEIHLDRDEPAAPAVSVKDRTLSNSRVSATVGSRGIERLELAGGPGLIDRGGIRVCAFEDFTDTWSHGIAGFEGRETGCFEAAGDWTRLDNGPIGATFGNSLRMDRSEMSWRVTVLADEPRVRMRIRLNWQGRHRVVKLLIPANMPIAARLDGTPGGRIFRACDGREYPFHNFTAVRGGRGSLAVVSADAFGVDVQRDGTIRLTLLRCPPFAHHDPKRLPAPHFYPVTDQGIHEYEIAVVAAREFRQEDVDREAHRQTRPIWIAETTLGMAKG